MTVRPKTASPRIRRLLNDQEYHCPCGVDINNANYYDREDVLVCGTCNLTALGLVGSLDEKQTS